MRLNLNRFVIWIIYLKQTNNLVQLWKSTDNNKHKLIRSDSMPENIFFNGDIFGIIDNGILALLSVFGIDIEKRLGGKGVYGALFGALIGNAISDFVAAVIDPSTQDIALGVFAGCMYVTLFVYVYVRFIKKDNL